MDGLGETDAVVAEVENRVVFADEDVAQDPQRSGRWRNVEADESEDAGRRCAVVHLEKKARKCCV